MSRRQPVSLPSRMMRTVRKVEAAAREATAGDPGTGQTIIRMARNQPPLRSLVESGKIGSLELQAAEEIALAVTAVSGRGILHAVQLERISHGRTNDSPWPAKVVLAVRNYQQWANYWSSQHKRTGNPMLEVIWSAVIDERPISVIAEEIGYDRRKTTRAIVAGLRNYAAFAGLIAGNPMWLAAADYVFCRRPPTSS